MADEDRCHTQFLRDPQKTRGGLTHLRDRAGRRSDLRRVERLHRVDHAHVGALCLERRADGLELRLGEDLNPARAAQTLGAELDLGDRFLTRHEQCATLFRDRGERGQEQRGLPNARLAADQHE